MAKIHPSDIDAFNQYFNLKVKHATETLLEYREELLKSCLSSTNRTVDFDRAFMLDMATRGFISCVGVIQRVAKEHHDADKSIEKQLDEILKYPFED